MGNNQNLKEVDEMGKYNPEMRVKMLYENKDAGIEIAEITFEDTQTQKKARKRKETMSPDSEELVLLINPIGQN